MDVNPDVRTSAGCGRVTFKYLMLGDDIREARIRKGLTQARLAKLAGVSRRHLAALEKGANVSVSILQRVAAVLELEEIQLGQLSLRAADKPALNVPLLTDTIREIREDAERANAKLARVEGILGNAGHAPGEMGTFFPRLPVRNLKPSPQTANVVREHPEWLELQTSGEIRQGHAVDESLRETVRLPRNLVDDGEVVFRFRGSALDDQGIEDGDLLVVETRPRGRASNGELVVGRIGKQLWIGRWWDKHGQKGLMSNGLSEVTASGSLKVVAAVNQIVRGL